MPSIDIGEVIVGVELGGTKVVVASTTDGRTVETRLQVATADPLATLPLTRAAIVEVIDGRTCSALGIASFGPIDLTKSSGSYGEILSSPKHEWVGINVVQELSSDVACPVGLETDVNAALLAEAEFGAARGFDNAAYLTVGTGVGGGLLIDGRLLHGSGHPEIGHVRVPRHSDDEHTSVCTFHTDCLEGMISGPAIQQRTGRSPRDLGEDGRDITNLVAWYLAHGIVAFCAVVAVDVVIVGGGVSNLPDLHEQVTRHLNAASGLYPPLPFAHGGPRIVAPELGDHSGAVGAFLVAQAARRESAASKGSRYQR